MIIDDEKDLADTTRRILEKKGYEVSIENGGKEGLMKAEGYKPDLILLDLKMPRLDGFEVVKRLKGNKNTTQIPIIAFTVLGYEEIQENEEYSLFDGYLGKPFSNNELISRVELALDEN